MVTIDADTAWMQGFNAYEENYDCPYCYPDLREAWYIGWWNALAWITRYRSSS